MFNMYNSAELAYNRSMHRNQPSGENHYKWKGDKVGYRSLHAWVAKKLGRPNKCDNCKIKSDKFRYFHWSNISGKYKRDLSDWQRLCRECHEAYDWGNMNLFVFLRKLNRKIKR